MLAAAVFQGPDWLGADGTALLEDDGGQSAWKEYLHRHQQAEVHVFHVEAEDRVVGERGVAIHQIVLICDRHRHECQSARETLISLVQQHDRAVYLILKNRKNLSEEHLRKLNLGTAPVVYIDGRRAEGWEVPGFLEYFAEDCGC